MREDSDREYEQAAEAYGRQREQSEGKAYPQLKITIILKGEDKTYRQNFLENGPVSACLDDPTIAECVREAKKMLNERPQETRIKIDWNE